MFDVLVRLVVGGHWVPVTVEVDRDEALIVAADEVAPHRMVIIVPTGHAPPAGS